MSRVLCLRGVSCGAESRAFSVDHLLAALDGDDTDPVYMELDSSGRLRAVGGRSARLCARAALAPHVGARSAELELCSRAALAPHVGARSAELELCSRAALAPHVGARSAELELCSRAALAPHVGARSAELELCSRAALAPHVGARSAELELCSRAALAPHVGARSAELELCSRAALAPHVGARSAELELCSPPLLRLRLAAALPPHAELLLWFAPGALAALAMPHLTPRNIRARRDYACHRCGATFADPNPLKVHLFLDCAPFELRAFWRSAAERLRAAAPAPEPRPGPAELEALATAWGRSRDGHRCLYCGKLYSRRYGLKIHIRTHTGYRPLRCRYCLRAFGDPSNLNKHVRLHAARGPAHAACGPAPAARYSCGECGRALARRRDLERHARTHTHTLSHTHHTGTPPREQ